MAGGAVSWESKRQVTVAASSTEAEFMAASFAAKETVWLRQLLHDLERHYIDPDERNVLLATVMYGDNTGSNDLTRNPKHHQRTKHIEVIYHFTREKIELNEISVEHVPTDNMPAEILTKSLSHVKHRHHMERMGLA